jgi:hypothetical protein
MGRLVGVGGLLVRGEVVRDLERDLSSLCEKTGFPEGPAGEFKWSPGKDLWMRDNLKIEPVLPLCQGVPQQDAA